MAKKLRSLKSPDKKIRTPDNPNPRTDKPLPITKTQKLRVIEELSVGFTPSTAFTRAGIKFDSARKKLEELKEDPWFAKELADRMVEQASELVISKERTLHEIAAVAFADIGDYHNPDGTPLRLEDIPPHARRAMKSISTKADEDGDLRVVEYTLHPKMDALLQLGRHFSMFTDKVDHTGTVSIKDESDVSLLNRAVELCRTLGVSPDTIGAGATVSDAQTIDVLPG